MHVQLDDSEELRGAIRAVEAALADTPLSLGARLGLGVSILLNIFRDLDTAQARGEVLETVGAILMDACVTLPLPGDSKSVMEKHIEVLRRAA